MKRAGSASDPQWYKDAIIYELHVKAFFDSNNDGIGDFGGLIQKLDYLQDLGVTCIWLLPFFPSPLRDDGYDIADYLNVHPSYGTMEDFQAFLDGAHERGLQVIIELVVNHTSDQHPWFQAARQAPAGSPERDFYVWSDTEQKYKDARIIFTDTEKSNWTWDPVAQAYFWHRFFSHQPDLNFDNPAVLAEILKVLRYWLDMGVDGVRLDAIPYLVERDGTNCENLPETHALIRRIRSEMDAEYSNRMILAEANQWPTDVRPYFGEGNECHMAFHFPLMPRIFISLRLEDRLPITDILAQTPEIPDNCQWGLFLRNHDELTLEMVSADERDYMYLAYSSDPRMRINIGIRRRLAPLMDNNRRRIELLSSLLFSFPGTPILYYGDELGMGDNIYLGDRNGVRTPMQWTGDRNGGFSRANPARLYSPLVMDPVYGYEALNVEAEQSDSSSLLNWMRNMIALRKLFRVFGRGSIEFLNPSNRKILAYLRRSEDGDVLCIANLSRFAQPVELDLSAWAGMKPVEMLGYVEFPTIGRTPYSLSLGPYGFMWFELQKASQSVPLDEKAHEEVSLSVPAGKWGRVFAGEYSELEAQVMRSFLSKQEWFGEAADSIETVFTVDWAEIEGRQAALLFVEVRFANSNVTTYCLPLEMTFGEAAERWRSESPNAILCPVVSSEGEGVLHDVSVDGGGGQAFLRRVDGRLEIPTQLGIIRGKTSLEASGTSVKLFRRVEAGPHPETEVAEYLTRRAHFDRVPPFVDAIEYIRDGSQPATLGMVQGLVEKEIDGATWIKEEMDRYFERCAHLSFPVDLVGPSRPWSELMASEPPELAREQFGLTLDAMALLGRRTGELHLALAAAQADPALEPERPGVEWIEKITGELTDKVGRTLEQLRSNLSRLPDEITEDAGLVLSRRRQILDSVRSLAGAGMPGMLIRVDGDFELECVARTKNDWLIVECAREPRPGGERRGKRSPLESVASMMRSLSSSVQHALLTYSARHPYDRDKLARWADLADQSSGSEFLRAYWCVVGESGVAPPDRGVFYRWLRARLLSRRLDELHAALGRQHEPIGVALQTILLLAA